MTAVGAGRSPAPAADSSPVVRWRHVAPAGSPIHAGDLLRWTGRLATASGAVDTLRETVCRTFDVRHCFPVSTGRAAMTLLLRALARLQPDRREVVVPAYTCFSVPASVIKAGLTPRLVDVDPLTLDAAPGQLEAIAGAPVLALIATNLYGLPNDLPAWSRAAARAGAFLIDDAAQAMGASVGGRASGTWGDAGLYSLDKGKNISAIDGGLLVTRSELVGRELERDWRAMRSPSHGTIAKDLAKVLAYAALLPPAVYWIPRSVPQLGLGTTPFTTDFPVDHLPAPLAALALTMLPRLATYNATRASHARELIAGLAGLDGVQVPAPVAEATGVYLRLPVIVDPPALRARVLEALGRQGIGATGSYPTSLADVPALRPHLANPDAAFPGARYVADRIVTLPTHPYVGRRDLARTIDAMHTALAGRPTPGTR